MFIILIYFDLFNLHKDNKAELRTTCNLLTAIQLKFMIVKIIFIHFYDGSLKSIYNNLKIIYKNYNLILISCF